MIVIISDRPTKLGSNGVVIILTQEEVKLRHETLGCYNFSDIHFVDAYDLVEEDYTYLMTRMRLKSNYLKWSL